ncbi:MAG: hypothetical protein HC765_06975 [Brachymonas sp.]|nr:hypothetical protein [Brachymonas sp.]
MGYSTGSILGVDVLNELLRRSSVSPLPLQKLAFLTLGNCIPALAALPQAQAYRAALRCVVSSEIKWVDYTAPIDWGSFPLTNPIDASHSASELLALNARAAKPVLKSPKFHTLFHSTHYQRIKADKYRVHQQYLMATELAGEYDYFAMTAGHESFLQRAPLSAEAQQP